MAAKQVSFIPDLEVLQAGCFEESGEVADRFRSHRIVVGPGLANHFASLRMRGLRRVGRGFPPAEFAGVTAQAQDTARRKSLECANQHGVFRREESRICKLFDLVGEADEVSGHVRARGLGWNDEIDLDLFSILRAKARSGEGQCGSG